MYITNRLYTYRKLLYGNKVDTKPMNLVTKSASKLSNTRAKYYMHSKRYHNPKRAPSSSEIEISH